jgi:alpha-1,3-glucan synthase
MLLGFSKLCKKHSWVLPIFAIGLGSPRWCQIVWVTSRLGLFLPWLSSSVISSLATRSLWLWLGVLDNIQGLGIGVMLLQTLTRHHASFVLVCAQVAGSMFAILGHYIGPAPIDLFPNLIAVESLTQLLKFSTSWFGVAFVLEALVCGMLFLSYRREQLWRP